MVKKKLIPMYPYFVKKEANKILEECDDICNNLNIVHFLWYGTCLGLVRDKTWIMTDRDIDVGIICSKEKYLELITQLKKKEYKKYEEGYLKNQLELDIYYKRFPKKSEKFLCTFEEITYNKRTYKVPSPVNEYLECIYGETWKILRQKHQHLKILIEAGYLKKEDIDPNILKRIFPMNVLICCGGKLGTYGAEFEHKEGITQKSDLSLGPETVIERMVRLLKKKGLIDITVAYTDEKPKITGVKFRKVIYKPLLQSTVYQCRDLINNTMIIEGDTVWELGFLNNIIFQDFEDCMYILLNIFMINPSGAKKMHQMYKKLRTKFEKGGWSKGPHGTKGGAGHRFGDLELPLTTEFNCKVKRYFSRYRVGDIDRPKDLAFWRKYLKEKEYSKIGD